MPRVTPVPHRGWRSRPQPGCIITTSTRSQSITSAAERPYQNGGGGGRAPLHVLALVDMGMPLGENFDLEELAADRAMDGVYEFWLDASPLPLVGYTGGMVNPVAVK